MKMMQPPAALGLSLILMCLLHLLFPYLHIIHFPLNSAGLIVIILALYFIFAGSNKFNQAKTTHMTFGEPNVLVTDGIYKYTRNPMYLGFVMLLLGVAVILGSLTPFFVVLAFIVITDVCYIKYEEKVLANIFGEAYLAYCNKTRRWI